MHRSLRFAFAAGFLSAAVLLVTPGAVAQMNGGSMGGQPGGMGQQQPGMQPGMEPGMQPGMQQNPAEMNFIGNMRRNLMAEEDLSKLALKNSSSDDVKKFAQTVITENRGSQSELTTMIAGQGPMFGPQVPSETRKAEKQMKKMSGTPFDAMYFSQMSAYVKNDQQITANLPQSGSISNLQQMAMELRNRSDRRTDQLAALEKAENIKIQ